MRLEAEVSSAGLSGRLAPLRSSPVGVGGTGDMDTLAQLSRTIASARMDVIALMEEKERLERDVDRLRGAKVAGAEMAEKSWGAKGAIRPSSVGV